MMPDISSPVGFFLGLVGVAGILALVYAVLSFLTSRSRRSSSTDRLTHELSRIATALESLVLQGQEANKNEPQPDPPPVRSAPLNIPNRVFRPDETEQKQPEEGSKKSGKIGLSMFGR
jgi:hypothetical protein